MSGKKSVTTTASTSESASKSTTASTTASAPEMHSKANRRFRRHRSEAVR
jgi:hypothetical protein